MKVAILISGHLRTAWYCLPFIKKYFVVPNNADVFIITGNNNFDNRNFSKNELDTCTLHKSRDNQELLKYNEKEFLYNVFGDSLKDYTKNNFIDNYWDEYKNIVDYTVHLSYDYRIKNKHKLNWDKPAEFVWDQYYFLRKCTEMLINYENKNNIKYDYIIRLRPDMFTLSPFIIEEKIKDKEDTDLFSVANSYHCGWLSEYFFFGKAEIMKTICFNFFEFYGRLRFDNEILEQVDLDPTFITEAQFYLFIKYLNIKRESLKGGATLYEYEVEETFNDIAKTFNIKRVLVYLLQFGIFQ